MGAARDLIILVTVDAGIKELAGENGEPVLPPTIADIRDALLLAAPFSDYIIGVSLMAQRERSMTETERTDALSVPNLYIIDDGTLDTVIGCTDCGWEGRYNPECPCDDNDDCQVRGEDWRVDQALEMAGEDHPDCDDPEGSSS